MNARENQDRLSSVISRYKTKLESFTLRGIVEEVKDKDIVRIVFEVPPDAPPAYAEIKNSDVIEIVPGESRNTGAVHVKRGADYTLSIVGVAGAAGDLPYGLRDIIEGSMGGHEGKPTR